MDFGQAAFDGANGGFDFLSWYAYVFQLMKCASLQKQNFFLWAFIF